MAWPDRIARQRRVISLSLVMACCGAALLAIALSLGWSYEAVGHVEQGMRFIVLIPMLTALLMRRRQAEDGRESRFWFLILAAFSVDLLTIPVSLASDLLWPDDEELYSYLVNGPYALYFLFLIAAMHVHPHVVHDPDTYPLRLLEWAGSMVLLLSMLTYFLVAPAMYSGQWALFWSSTLVMWLVLDVYMMCWLLFLRAVADQHMWRTTYSWLLAGVAIWTLGDLSLMLVHESVLPYAGESMAQFLFVFSFCAVAKSTAVLPVSPKELEVSGPVKVPLGTGPLVLYASIPLLLHILIHRFGNPEQELALVREGIALAAAVLLSGLTLTYHRLVRAENQRLAAEQAASREELVHRAFHDQLTELPNRILFGDRLQMAIAHAVRNQCKCAVMFCDLDQFKVINDSLGHEAGDQTLITTAHRLRDSVRRQDTVARLGGDEFAVLMTDFTNPQDAAHLAKKLLAAISEPMDVAGKSHVMTASIGVAVYPDDGTTEDAILKHADIAMYQSKIHGRNTYRLFTEAMNVAAKERLAIEQGLRTGLIEDQFVVLYQPIVDLDTGCALGYEALVRWHDTEQGYISPASFIDVAEQTGLIVPIGHWVLETACAWAVTLPPVNGDLPIISVNLSARQLREPEMAANVASVLEQTGLAPERLQLEITESTVLSNDACRAAMLALRDLGVLIAIDDFGTGYSALSRLRDMPVDTIKIDGSFVRRIESNSVSEAIVHAVLSMAGAMELNVVAEGVETGSELAVIRRAGCSAVQGYYFCEPLSAEELEQRLVDLGYLKEWAARIRQSEQRDSYAVS